MTGLLIHLAVIAAGLYGICWLAIDIAHKRAMR